MSGAKKQRPGLKEALGDAREGDAIVVWRLDRLERNMQDLIQIVNSLNERYIRCFYLKNARKSGVSI